MAWPEKLKLKKGLILSLSQAGYQTPKELQLKTLSRINGGQDVIAVGPEGCGKTTTAVLAVLNRFTYTADGITKALVLVHNRDKVLSVISRFEEINHNRSISIVGLYAAPGTEAQMDAMAEGADIVVATPDRARVIYLKLGLNLNKVELLVMDDAELLVKQGLQLPVAELNQALIKCQRLVFTEVMHDKLEKMIGPFMKQPTVVEVEEESAVAMELHPQLLYRLPNFGTKLNLLRLFVQDADIFTKAVVFVNTRPTAEKLYQTLKLHLKNAVTVFNSWHFEMDGSNSIGDFMADSSKQVLIVADEEIAADALQKVPFLIHFELPATPEAYLNRVVKGSAITDDETLALTFATDLELAAVKKIEQVSGQKMATTELPENLVIQTDKKPGADEAKPSKHKNTEPVKGKAFHEKKASNAKTYNYRAGVKAKMSKKKKHG